MVDVDVWEDKPVIYASTEVKQHLSNNSVIYYLKEQSVIMHIVSFFAQQMGKICKTEFSFYEDKPPFEKID